MSARVWVTAYIHLEALLDDLRISRLPGTELLPGFGCGISCICGYRTTHRLNARLNVANPPGKTRLAGRAGAAWALWLGRKDLPFDGDGESDQASVCNDRAFLSGNSWSRRGKCSKPSDIQQLACSIGLRSAFRFARKRSRSRSVRRCKKGDQTIPLCVVRARLSGSR